MARRPRPGTGGSLTGPGTSHLGLRLSAERTAQLRKIVEAANRRAEERGDPGIYTASALISAAIWRYLDEETARIEAEDKKRRK